MKKIYLLLFTLPFITSCSVENLLQDKPLMYTYEPTSVLTTSAILGGSTLSEMGNNITEYGIVYSTEDAPTITDTKIAIGERIGDFNYRFEIFSPGTTYYYRSYGTNSIGTGYGETYSFTTQEEAPCSHEIDNRLYTGVHGTININQILRDDIQAYYSDGNVKFSTRSNYSNIRIELVFNEINAQLPKTGTYHTVYDFDESEGPSQGEVMIGLLNFYGSYDENGFSPKTGHTLYVENDDNGNVTFTFCNEEFSQYYTLDGKFTYHE